MAGFAPLRTQRKNPLTEFLDFYLPEMLKQKMQLDQVKKQAEIWLRNQLKEYEVYGDIQAKQGKESFRRSALINMINPDYFKNRPYPENEVAKVIQNMFPRDVAGEIGVNIPPDAEAKLAEAVAGITNLGQSRQALDNMPAEQIAPIVRAFGEKPVLDVLNQIGAEKQKVAERGVREKELSEAVKSRGLRAEELGVRKAEAETEKGGKEKLTQIRARLEKREAEVNDYVDRYLGITGGMYGGLKPEEQGKIIGQIERVMADVKQTRKSLGIKEPQNMSEIISRLKAAGRTKESLLDNLKLRNGFINLGIDPLIFMEYLDSAGAKKK